jgi:hypothetical protein
MEASANPDPMDQVPAATDGMPVDPDELMPVPPYAAPIAVPFQVPVVIVPTEVIVVVILLLMMVREAVPSWNVKFAAFRCSSPATPAFAPELAKLMLSRPPATTVITLAEIFVASGMPKISSTNVLKSRIWLSMVAGLSLPAGVAALTEFGRATDDLAKK